MATANVLTRRYGGISRSPVKRTSRASDLVLSRKATLYRGRSDYIRDEINYEEEAKKLDKAINKQLNIEGTSILKPSIPQPPQEGDSDEDYDTDLEDPGKKVSSLSYKQTVVYRRQSR